MNNLLFFYANQHPCQIPTKIQNNLRDKIKRSDFLITDKKGTQRMVGIMFNSETMNAPIITFVCMRYEMVNAKQIAFELNKKIYYDSTASAILFKYQIGETLSDSDFYPIALLYAKFYPTLHKTSLSGINITESGEIYIKGHLLPPHYRISELINSLGSPDKSYTGYGDFSQFKYYEWYEYGLRAISSLDSKGFVSAIAIYIQKPKYTNMKPAIADVTLCGINAEQAGPYYMCRNYGSKEVRIYTLDNEQSVELKKGDIAIIYVEYSKKSNSRQ